MDQRRILAIRILELFEDVLEEKNITIPDEDRTGSDEEARLYGMTYANLEDAIVEVLKNADEVSQKP